MHTGFPDLNSHAIHWLGQGKQENVLGNLYIELPQSSTHRPFFMYIFGAHLPFISPLGFLHEVRLLLSEPSLQVT